MKGDSVGDIIVGAKRHAPLLMVAIVLMLASCPVQQTSAIFNCFSPSMMKPFGKLPGGQQGYMPERPNWYPQQQQQPQPQTSAYLQGYYGPNMHPMKLLFQPKWKTSSLFGPKNWPMGGWKMGTGSMFMRPAYQYPQQAGPVISGNPFSGYHYGEQLQLSPYSNMQSQLSSYTSSPNDGWSTPVAYNPVANPIQQTTISNYDNSYNTSPTKQQVAPLVDPYSSTKGSSTKYSSSTTKNAFYDDYIGSPYMREALKNKTFGYSYPDWYSGAIESPGKIAQQLMRQNLKIQHNRGRSAALIKPSSGSSESFTILDEPRFVGFGTIESLNNKEARLSCSFNEAINQINKPIWIKFLGPYNSSILAASGINDTISGSSDAKKRIVPPFNCHSSQCRTQEVDTSKDYRYRFDHGPATSTLIISEPRLSDYGTYRCSALTKAINNNPLETIYQIVEFGAI